MEPSDGGRTNVMGGSSDGGITVGVELAWVDAADSPDGNTAVTTK